MGIVKQLEATIRFRDGTTVNRPDPKDLHRASSRRVARAINKFKGKSGYKLSSTLLGVNQALDDLRAELERQGFLSHIRYKWLRNFDRAREQLRALKFKVDKGGLQAADESYPKVEVLEALKDAQVILEELPEFM